MKTYTVRWRQTFETKLECEIEASSEQAAIKKAQKLSATFNSPDDADRCYESYRAETYGGDDFQAEEM